CCGNVVWPWLSSFESPAHPVKSLTSNCPAPGAHSRRTTSLYKNSPVRFHAIGSVDTLHLTTPGVEKKNDHVIANVPSPINEPSADRIGINARQREERLSLTL